MAEAGFAATTAVQFPGEFATRGGLLDVFSADHSQPIRIEWFGDEIESIRRFDPASQRSVESLDHIEIAAIGISADEAIVDPYDDPQPREQTADAGGRDDVELGPITDYLPADTLVVIVDPQDCAAAAKALLARSSDTSHFIDFDQLLSSFNDFRVVTATHLAEAGGDEVIDLCTNTADSFAASLDETRGRVDSVAADHDVLVVGDTPADAERLSQLLSDTNAARQGRLHFCTAEFSGGFRLVAAQVLVLTGAELFHRSPVRRGRSRARGQADRQFAAAGSR